MASAAPTSLPVLYREIMPLSSAIHADWRMQTIEGAPELARTHAVPLLAEEFVFAHRFFPIVFSIGPTSVPLALMGLNEGVNVFVDERGMFTDDVYVPAYIRRYPFLLARLREGSDDLSLCVDTASGIVGAFDEGDPVFEGTEPAARTKQILSFCEDFEQASQRTAAFVRDIEDAKLITEGEFTIQTGEGAPPHVYRGFRMVSEEALRDLRGDVARKLLQSGAMTLLFAHLFSLQRMNEVFARQRDRGSLPPANGPMPS